MESEIRRKIKWNIIVGLIIIIVNSLWIYCVINLLYVYYYSDILFFYRNPDWVLIFNSILGLIGILIGINVIIGQIGVKKGIIIDLIIFIAGNILQFIISLI